EYAGAVARESWESIGRRLRPRIGSHRAALCFFLPPTLLQEPLARGAAQRCRLRPRSEAVARLRGTRTWRSLSPTSRAEAESVRREPNPPAPAATIFGKRRPRAGRS